MNSKEKQTMKKKKMIIYLLILCMLFCIFPVRTTPQYVYASSLTKKEKAAYMSVINEMKRECIDSYKEWLFDYNCGFSSYEVIIDYKFIDIDKDGKKEMLLHVDPPGATAIENCYVYKYSNGKVQKKLFISSMDLYSGCSEIALTSNELIIYSHSAASVYDRKTYKNLFFTEDIDEDGYKYGLYRDSNNNVCFANGGKKVTFTAKDQGVVYLGENDKEAYKVYQGESIKIGKGTRKGTWSSSNNKVASVDKNGKVTGKKTGSAYIYFDNGKYFVECNLVKVKKKQKFTDGVYYVVDSYGKVVDSYGKISGNKYQIEAKVENEGSGKKYPFDTYTFTIAENCKFGCLEEDKFYSCSKNTFIKEYLSLYNMQAYFQLKNGKIVKLYVTPYW